ADPDRPVAADADPVDVEPVDALREARVLEGDPARLAVDREAERGGDRLEERARRPRLRRAGDGVRHGPALVAAREAAEELRHASEREVARGVDEDAEEGGRRVGLAVAAEAAGEDRVVVRPDRAVVVAHRVVAAAPDGERPHAEAREEVRLEDAARDERRVLRRGGPGPEHVARVRRGDAARALLAIEREDVRPELVVPEGA